MIALKVKHQEPEIDEEAAERVVNDMIDSATRDPRRPMEELEAYLAPMRRYTVLRDRDAFDRVYDRFRQSPDAEKRLTARDELVYGNIKLVLSVALRYTRRGLPLLDLMQEGTIGLMTGIDKYEPILGYRFSTYGRWWIRQAITRAIANQCLDRPLRLPVHVQEDMQIVRKALYGFFRKKGHMPTDFELFKAIREMSAPKAQQMGLQHAVQIMRMLVEGRTLELDAPRGDDPNDESNETRVSDPFQSTEVLVESRRMLERYTQALARIETEISTLPPRDAMVLRLRYGLGEFEAMTLEEIGQRYELTRERIRQIEAKAIDTLSQRLSITAEQIVQIVHAVEELSRIAASA